MAAEDEKDQRESELYDKKWVVGYANSNKAVCKDNKCLSEDKKISKNELRIGRRFPSPFSSDAISVNWYHARCMFNQLTRSRKATQVIQKAEDLDGFHELSHDDQHFITQLIKDFHAGDALSAAPAAPTARAPAASTRGAARDGPTTAGRKSKRPGEERADPPTAKKPRSGGGVGRRDDGRIIML